MEDETYFSSSSSSLPNSPISNPNPNPKAKTKKNKKKLQDLTSFDTPSWPRKGGGVMLEGYVESPACADGGDSVTRTKSLTDDDLEELKGCLDLGFGFSYEEIPELCNTLPALELCYSLSQRFNDEQKGVNGDDVAAGDSCSSAGVGAPVANWKISSPGDHPEDVKARLKYRIFEKMLAEHNDEKLVMQKPSVHGIEKR